jgi:uncharacterized protein involved in cysteine biosynthesis
MAALMRALRDLFQPRIVAVMLLPMAGAFALWAALAWFFWGSWTDALNSLAAGTAAGRWLESAGAGWLLHSVTALGAIALVIPAMLITAAVITELVAMPVIVGTVAARRFPHLERRRGGTATGSVVNALAGIAIFIALWIVTLPLWFTGIAAVMLPAFLSAYLSQRLFRYDTLAEHASAEEYRALVRNERGRLYLLGLVLAGLYYIPVVNLVAPAEAAQRLTLNCLGRVLRMRRA